MENTQNEIYRHYIALDWSQQIVAMARMDAASPKIELQTFLPDVKLIKQYLKKYTGKKILTIEETTTSHWLYVELKESVDRILVCNPYRNSLLKDGPKTDKIDAGKLCLLLRNGMLKEVFHSMDKSYELRKLVSTYEDFIKASVRLKNQRSSVFRAEGKNHKKEKIICESQLKKFITEKYNSSIEHIAQIRNEFEQMFRRIKKENKAIRQLVKISGIGDKLAVTILALVVDANRFENKYKYYAYCGLAKHQKESGNKNYGSKEVKYSRILKRTYKVAALAAIGGKNDIREYFEYLLQNNYGYEKARNEIARYIAKVSYAVIKNKTDYRAYQWRESKS
jgi:transposase